MPCTTTATTNAMLNTPKLCRVSGSVNKPLFVRFFFVFGGAGETITKKNIHRNVETQRKIGEKIAYNYSK